MVQTAETMMSNPLQCLSPALHEQSRRCQLLRCCARRRQPIMALETTECVQIEQEDLNFGCLFLRGVCSMVQTTKTMMSNPLQCFSSALRDQLRRCTSSCCGEYKQGWYHLRSNTC